MNNPFRYTPSSEILEASKTIIKKIDDDPALYDLFKEGKMMGILLVENDQKEKSFLYAFSGNVQGKNNIEGFVPPIYDLLDPDGYFKKEEAEISLIGKSIQEAENSYRFKKAVLDCESIIADGQKALERAKKALEGAKKTRDEKRATFSSLSHEERLIEEKKLISESQFEKAEFRRLKKNVENDTLSAQNRISEIYKDINALKEERKLRSDALQRWIFQQFIVHNAKGESLNIEEVFRRKGLIPPGGTGECAAPKLLEYAYRNNLSPIGIGEFWYGDTSSKNIHIQGSFYPSCQAKCGPLLEFMLEGLDIEKTAASSSWEIIYEDDYLLAVDKPSGILSVPGKTGDKSLLELISEEKGFPVYSIHRLDMDTSGLILFAKSLEVQSQMQAMFETRDVQKEYQAILDPRADANTLPTKGKIDLSMSADYENRPRQIVDNINGKRAITEYSINSIDAEGRIKVTFFPKTGRTHQLRVHSVHPDGLGAPICGDKLYGSITDCKLQLRAVAINFIHPLSHKRMCLSVREGL